jgi:peptide/nickel transport system permease protein
MIHYVLRRIGTMAVTLLVISLLIFLVIKLPPGDYITNQIEELRAQGETASIAKAEQMRVRYNLDKPVLYQYGAWMGVLPGHDGYNGMLQGNCGWSFEYNQPVCSVIGSAIGLTIVLNLLVIVFIHLVSIPIAIYSATNKNSIGAYSATFLGYIGLATPSFLLALILLYYLNRWFGISIGGLYDPKYANEPWSLAKLQSLLGHLIVPVVVIGLASTAGMIRRLRANLLDELAKQYTVTAKAKGLPPGRALLKYPFRIAMTPFVADIGNLLPSVVSGSAIVSIVLSLPTVGPTLVQALKSQDQYLAGFILLFVACLTVVGMFIADLALALLDPRIRLAGGR